MSASRFILGRQKRLTEAEFDKAVSRMVSQAQSVQPFEDMSSAAQEKRIKRATRNPFYFMESYMPHRFAVPFAPCHRAWMALARQAIRNDLPGIIIAGRGLGKSQIMTLGDPIHRMLTMNTVSKHPYNFLCVFSDTESQAKLLTAPIAVELEYNKRIIWDFGEQTAKPWGRGEFRTSGGVFVWARGKAQAARGVKDEEGVRINHAILDDFEGEERSQNPDLVEDDYDTAMSGIYPAMAEGEGEFRLFLVLNNKFAPHGVIDLMEKNEGFLSIDTPLIRDGAWSDRLRQYIRGRSAWPGMWPLPKISKRRFVMGKAKFLSEYCNQSKGVGLEEFQVHRFTLTTAERPRQAKRVLSFDPSIKQAVPADFKAICVLERGGRVTRCLSSRIRRCSMVEACRYAYGLARTFGVDDIVVEAGLDEWVKGEMLRQCPPDMNPLRMHWQPHGGVEKIARIKRTFPDAELGLILIADGQLAGDNDMLVEQYDGLYNKNVHDDGPDSFEKGYRWLSENQAIESGHAVVGKSRNPFTRDPDYAERYVGL